MFVELSDGAWTALAAVHGAATWFLVGLIWTTQLVHYPGFSSIATDGYERFQAAHIEAMGRLVGIPWLLEGLTVLAVFAAAPDTASLVLATVGGVAAAVTIAVTVLASIPAHRGLSDGYDAAAHERLLATNWIRTTAWSVRGVVATALLL